jgi:hypothetical protein
VTRGAPPIFVVGCPRSGTSLLRLMLDAHPEVAIPPESHFIPGVWRVRERYGSGVAFDAERMAREVFTTLRFQDWHLPPEGVLAQIRATEPRDLAGAIEAFFLAYARAHGKPRWGDKTPGYALDMPLIAGLFPDARFIHLIRDGRNVALSLMDVPRPPRSLTEAAQVWKHRIDVARRDTATLGDAVLEVRYETLVDDPESVLKEVCAHTSLDFTPVMFDYYRGEALRSVPEREWGHHQNLTRPPTRDVRDWRATMSEADQMLFEAVAGAELSALGYERRFATIPANVRAKAAAAVAFDGARHRLRAVRVTAWLAKNRDALPPPRRW